MDEIKIPEIPEELTISLNQKMRERLAGLELITGDNAKKICEFILRQGLDAVSESIL